LLVPLRITGGLRALYECRDSPWPAIAPVMQPGETSCVEEGDG